MKRLLTLLLVITSVCVSAQTVDAFGEHRYASFLLAETDSNSIVFVGNSITNMHEWSEALQNHDVKGRGVSSTNAWRQLAYIENYLIGRPKKMFIMLGTNDMTTIYNFTLQQFIANMRCIVSRAQHECPGIEIYIQSILPAQDSYGRSVSKGQTWNDALKELAAEYGLTYIDLTAALGGMCQSADQSLTRDGLHPTVRGYNIWLKEIMPYLPECARQYPDDITNSYSTELSQAAANMHTEQFNQLDINDGDILFIGDEVVNAGEWHDIFHSFKVKNRGNGWNWPWYAVAGMKTTTYKLMNAAKAAKASRIFMHAGVYEASKDRMSAQNFVAQMQDWVTRLGNNGYALNADKPIYIVGTAPCSDATGNLLIKQYHEALSEWCDGVEGLHYVGAFDGTIDASGNVTVPGMVVGTSSTGFFLYEEGYRRMADALLPYVREVDDKASVMTADALAERKERIAARTALGDAINAIEKKMWADAYEVTDPEALSQAVEDAYALLAANEAGNDVLLERIDILEKAATDAGLTAARPKVSTDGETHWYLLHTPLRDNYYLTAPTGTGVVKGAASPAGKGAHWCLMSRADGDLDIVSRLDGSFVSPASATNTAVRTVSEQPAAGWKLLEATNDGYFIIVSGETELNQTKSSQSYQLFNWGYGNPTAGEYNFSDAGCQFMFTELWTPTVSTESKTYWYTLQDVRGSKFVCSNGAGQGITGVDMSDDVKTRVQWKFSLRDDGTLDIINRYDGSLIPSGTVATGTQIAAATANSGAGWDILPSAADGYYIVVSGTSQFNMSNSGTVRNLLNWGSGSNTTDTGCQYAIALAECETHIPDAVTCAKAATPLLPLYDLQGRRATPRRHGLYIQGNKKVIIH